MNKYLNNQNIVRIIRAIIGASLAIAAYLSGHYVFVGLGILFIVQAIFNVSCCSSGGCNTDNSTENKALYKDQIKNYKK